MPKNTYEETQRYTEPATVASNCIDITFYNSGSKTAYVNTFPLVTGQSKQISCNEGEVLTSPYAITFATGVGATEIYVFRRYNQ